MPDETRQVTTQYVAKLDTPSYQKVAQQLKQQSDIQIKNAKGANTINDDIRNAIKLQVKEQEKLNKAQKESIKAEKTRLDILDEQNSRLRRQVGSIGDVDSALSAIRGGTGAITGTGNVPGLEQAAAVFEVTEAIVQLKGAAPAAKEAILGLVNSMGASGVGLAAVAAVAVVAIVAVTKAVNEQWVKQLRDFKAQIEADNQSIEELNSGSTYQEIFDKRAALLIQLKEEGDQIGEANKKLDELNSKDIGTRIGDVLSGVKQAAIDNLSTLSDTYAKDVALLDNYNNILKDNSTVQNDAAQEAQKRSDIIREQFQLEQRVNQFAKTATTETLKERLESLELERQAILSQREELAQFAGNTAIGSENRQRLAELEKQLASLNTETDILNGTVGQSIILRTNQAEAEKALDEQRKAQDKKREDAAKQREATLNKITSLEVQATDLLADFALKQTELIQERGLRDRRELEDFNTKVERAQSDHQSKLAEIQSSGNEQIQAIHANLDSLQSDYFKEDIKATEIYRKDLKKLNRQYQIEDKQQLEDHLASLRDAEQNNDVLAFLNEQAKFKQEQRQKEQGRSEEFRQLNEQFQEERRLRQLELQERRKDLETELSVTRQQTAQKIAEANKAFENDQRIEAQDRERKLQRQQQDDQIADQRARDALQRSLNDINTKAQAELNAIRAVVGATTQIEAVARRISAIASNTSSRGTSTSSYSGSSSYSAAAARLKTSAAPSYIPDSKAKLVAYANGGIVDRPTNSLLGDRVGYNEAVIPFKKSKGLQSALREYGIMRPFGSSGRGGSGSPVQLNFAPNVTVGEIASPSEVTTALQSFANDLQRQIEIAFSTSVNQAG